MSKTHPGDLAPRNIRMSCPSCRGELRVPRERIGRKTRCIHCEHIFRARPEDDQLSIRSLTELAPRTTTFIEIPCPKCQRSLRVRTKHLGRQGGCKHCQHHFLLSLDPPREVIYGVDDPPAATATAKPTVETAKTERRAFRTEAEDASDRRTGTSQGSSEPAAPGRSARTPRRARKSSLIAKLAAVCLFGGGAALYLREPSLADYGRRLPLIFTKNHLLSPGDRGRPDDRPSLGGPSTGSGPRPDERRTIICSGRVEPIRGEVDVSAQIEGQLAEVRVTEGAVVEEGAIVAVLEGPREVAELSVAEANVAIARSRLKRVSAGNGPEEIQQALHEVEAQDALLAFETKNLGRMARLVQRRTLSQEDYERQERKVEQLQRLRDGLRKHYEAVRRGPLPQEIEVARDELALAEQRFRRVQVEHDLRIVRAPLSGTILEVYRHAGDSVITDQPTPILRMADTSQLRIRLEIDEASVTRLQPGLEGTVRIRGATADAGRVTVTTIIPMFGPKRLFNPDTSARYDTRTLAVFCAISDVKIPLYPGQRVTASLTEAAHLAGSTPIPSQEKHALPVAKTD